MAPKLYLSEASSPCRSVLLTAKALNLNLELISISVTNKRHLTPDFLKINPQHTIPTLVETDGRAIWGSLAISAYLVDKYGKDDKFYPKDLQKRAIVNQRLHFDSGILFPRLRTALAILKTGVKIIPESNKNDIIESYNFLEIFLEGKLWLIGNEVTIADFCTIPTVTSLDLLVSIDDKKYPRLSGWIKRCQCWLYYGVNQSGLEKLRNYLGK